MTDRELDALVAEKIFGWDPEPYRVFKEQFNKYEKAERERGSKYSFFISTARNNAERDIIHKFKLKNTRDVIPKYYSTDMNCAFDVVEKMREKGFNMFLVMSNENKSYVSFVRNEIPIQEQDITLTSGPVSEKICLAALRSVGIEVS